MFSRAFILLFFILLSRSAYAQFTYTQDQSIPVMVNGKTIGLPWSGAFNSPQFSTIDLNGDNLPDLVIYDRSTNVLLTYLNLHDSAYQFAPEYATLFPPQVDQWLLLRDYNHDGKKDIFTYNLFGISVYTNITPPGEPLAWRAYGGSCDTAGGNYCPHPLRSVYFKIDTTNLQVNQMDNLSIDDIDGDGAIDILDAHFSGVGYVEWHRNMNWIKTGNYDSMQMELATENWGNFDECNCGEYLFGGGTCTIYLGRIKGTNGTQHAAAKSILTIDLDGDGLRDLLFSEETCTTLYFMKNTGTQDSANFASDSTNFPPSHPVNNFQIFPAAFYDDFDFDGIPDLMVASAIYDRTSLAVNFEQSAWFYKNTGTQKIPNFQYVKNNFLQDQMIEVGDNSVPAFIDADGDGDQDMFIGSYTSQDTVSHLFYYKNTGSVSNPSFQYVTNDYNRFSMLGYYNLKPQFADMDGDGSKDFVFTATNMNSGVTGLYYLPNKSKDSLNVSMADLTQTGFTIDIGENVLIIDVDLDGINDLLLGTATGALEYYHNGGPKGSFNYTLLIGNFLGLGTTTARQNPVPAAGDLNSDGKTDLILGDQNGGITIFNNFRSQDTTTVKKILYNPLSQTYMSKDWGGTAWPVVVNIFNTTYPSIVTGNFLGGIQILKNDGGANLPTSPVVSIYPNPVLASKTFTIKSDQDVMVQIFTTLGQKISGQFLVSANVDYTVATTGLASGVYIARFSVPGKTFARRFIIY